MSLQQTTIASAAIHALSFDQRNAAYEHGERTSRNKLESLDIAKSAATTLGPNPTFEQWNEYADEWKAGYIHANPDNTANAADQAWKTFVDGGLSLYGLSKPKSTNVAAEKKIGRAHV